MQFLKEGMEVDHKGPADFAVYITEEIDRWARLVKKANIKVEGMQ